jgi:hypothetical protein
MPIISASRYISAERTQSNVPTRRLLPVKGTPELEQDSLTSKENQSDNGCGNIQNGIGLSLVGI